jgi:hypothetical protein
MIDADAAMAGAATRGLAMAPRGSSPRAHPASVHPTPIRHRYVASPRIWRVGAPVCSVVVGDPSIGATADFPRADGRMAVRVGMHAVVVSNSETEHLGVDEAHEFAGTPVNGTKLRELRLKMRFSLPAKSLRFPIKRGSCCHSKVVNYA